MYRRPDSLWAQDSSHASLRKTSQLARAQISPSKPSCFLSKSGSQASPVLPPACSWSQASPRLGFTRASHVHFGKSRGLMARQELAHRAWASGDGSRWANGWRLMTLRAQRSKSQRLATSRSIRTHACDCLKPDRRNIDSNSPAER